MIVSKFVVVFDERKHLMAEFNHNYVSTLIELIAIGSEIGFSTFVLISTRVEWDDTDFSPFSIKFLDQQIKTPCYNGSSLVCLIFQLLSVLISLLINLSEWFNFNVRCIRVTCFILVNCTKKFKNYLTYLLRTHQALEIKTTSFVRLKIILLIIFFARLYNENYLK